MPRGRRVEEGNTAGHSDRYVISEMTWSLNETAVILSAEDLDTLIAVLGDNDLRIRLLEARAEIERQQ